MEQVRDWAKLASRQVSMVIMRDDWSGLSCCEAGESPAAYDISVRDSGGR